MVASSQAPHNHNNKWKRSQKNLVHVWLQRARILSLIHQKANRFYLRMHQYIHLPASVFSSLSTGILCAQLRDAGVAVPTWLIITNVVMAALATALTVVSFFYDFVDIAKKHDIAHEGYNRLIHAMELEMSLDAGERSPYRKFMHKIEKKFEKIGNSTPSIPRTIYNRFRTQIKNKMLTLNIEDLVQQKMPTYYTSSTNIVEKKHKKRGREKRKGKEKGKVPQLKEVIVQK